MKNVMIQAVEQAASHLTPGEGTILTKVADGWRLAPSKKCMFNSSHNEELQRLMNRYQNVDSVPAVGVYLDREGKLQAFHSKEECAALASMNGVRSCPIWQKEGNCIKCC